MKILFYILCVFLLTFLNVNAQQWQKLFGNDDYENDPYELYQIAVNTKGDIFVIAYFLSHDTTSWFYRSTDKGKTWTGINIESKYKSYDMDYLFRYYNKIRINSEDMIFITLDTTIIRSTDNGNTFETVLDGEKIEKLLGFKSNHNGWLYFDFAPNGDIFSSTRWTDSNPYSDDYHIFKSMDNGDNWNIVAKNTNQDFAKLSFDNDGIVYTAKDYGAYWSEDTCKTWNYFNLDSMIMYSTIEYPISLDIDNLGNIFILDEPNNIIKSTDKGETWNVSFLTGQGMPGYNIETTKNGWIFSPQAYSLDNGNNWKSLSLVDNFYTTDSACYAITMWNREIWKFSNDPVFVDDNNYNSEINIFPNPAKDFININYNFEIQGNIEIKLYNHLGIELRSLTKYIGTDSKTITLDCRDFVSGNYYISININNLLIMKKFIIIK
jgi:hypothetical protein